jgi:hypothetical protein
MSDGNQAVGAPPPPAGSTARTTKAWQWLLGAVLLPALAGLLGYLLAPAQLAIGWNGAWSALLPANTTLIPVANVDWNNSRQIWQIGKDEALVTHDAVAVISIVVSTKLPEGTAIGIIPHVTPDNEDDCPRVRMVAVQSPIYVPVMCVLKLKAGARYTYSVWINPDAKPQPDASTPSLVRGSILVNKARF